MSAVYFMIPPRQTSDADITANQTTHQARGYSDITLTFTLKKPGA